MTKVAVVFHSGYGHTQRMAQAVAEGAGAELVAIDAEGNATYSGTLAASKLLIANPSVEGATVSGSLAGNETIGAGIIPINSMQIVITTTKVTPNSFIYITPTTDTGDQVLYVVSKTPGVSFTVGMNKKYSTDVQFNWWIIN